MGMERDTVVRAINGDPHAYESIVEEFTPTVRGAAFGLCGDHELAADITQDVFATAYLKLATVRDPDALPGWLMAVTRSCARAARRSTAAVEPSTAAASLEDTVIAADEARRARLAVEALPPAERLPMALHCFAGHRLSEIAELCEVPLSTVKKRMRVARARLLRGDPEMTTEPSSTTPTTDAVRLFAALPRATRRSSPRSSTPDPISSTSVKGGPTTTRWPTGCR